MTKPPLGVHLVWHPDDPDSVDLAQELFTTLAGETASAGVERLGLPVWFHTLPERDKASQQRPFHRPPPVDLNLTDKTVLVVLISDALLGDATARQFVADLRKYTQGDDGKPLPLDKDPLRFVGIALTREAFGATDLFGTSSLVRVFDLPRDQLAPSVVIPVLASAARLLDPTPPRVFISHAKLDGAVYAREIERALSQARLEGWVDAFDIVEGADFASVIDEALHTAFVAVLTDEYSRREWCRYEALTAKHRRLPMVVLNALTRVDTRTIPYLGNAPTVRLAEGYGPGRYDELIVQLLAELLRGRWFQALPAHGATKLPFPPELLTLHGLLREADAAERERAKKAHKAPDFVKRMTVVYPDPPLSTVERKILEEATGHRVQLVTSTQHRAGYDRAMTAVSDKFVVLSVSDVPDDKLVDIGLSRGHLDLLFTDLCSHLLAAGYGLAYGGDLRARGFTDVLFDLARSYDPTLSTEPSERSHAAPRKPGRGESVTS